MGITTATRVGRQLGRMAAGALMALVLGGLAAAPAGATTRDDGRNEANDFITWCYTVGGDPVVIEASDSKIVVACHNLPGGDFLCEFYPKHWCHLSSGRLVPDGISDVDIMPADQGNAPVNRPVLAIPAEAGRPILIEDGGAANGSGVQFAEGAATVSEPADSAPVSAPSLVAEGSGLAEVAPAEVAAVEVAPVEVAPVEVAPVEVAPAEVAPAEVAPVESGQPAPADEPVAESVEAAAPAESQVAPVDEPIDEQA